MQVGTYNVNGRRPPADLDLRPWLDMANQPADIVAVGFQEVVPLNAGNVVMGMQYHAKPCISDKTCTLCTRTPTVVTSMLKQQGNHGEALQVSWCHT